VTLQLLECYLPAEAPHQLEVHLQQTRVHNQCANLAPLLERESSSSWRTNGAPAGSPPAADTRAEPVCKPCTIVGQRKQQFLAP
jgi:hypothetical protein